MERKYSHSTNIGRLAAIGSLVLALGTDYVQAGPYLDHFKKGESKKQERVTGDTYDAAHRDLHKQATKKINDLDAKEADIETRVGDLEVLTQLTRKDISYVKSNLVSQTHQNSTNYPAPIKLKTTNQVAPTNYPASTNQTSTNAVQVIPVDINRPTRRQDSTLAVGLVPMGAGVGISVGGSFGDWRDFFTYRPSNLKRNPFTQGGALCELNPFNYRKPSIPLKSLTGKLPFIIGGALLSKGGSGGDDDRGDRQEYVTQQTDSGHRDRGRTTTQYTTQEETPGKKKEEPVEPAPTPNPNPNPNPNPTDNVTGGDNAGGNVGEN